MNEKFKENVVMKTMLQISTKVEKYKKMAMQQRSLFKPFIEMCMCLELTLYGL